MNKATLFTIAITLFCLAWTTTNGIVVVEKIQSNGLMFRNMGHVYAYKKNWKIVTVITKNKFLKEEKFIQTRIEELENLKLKYKNKNIDMVLNEFKRLAEIINEINTIVMGEQPERNKRSVIPIGGTFVQWLLGNPDEETLLQIFQQIDELRKHNEFTDSITKNNTIYMGKLIDAIEKRNIQANDQINSIIENLSILASNNSAFTNTVLNNDEINMLTQSLTLVIIRYWHYQNKLLDHILSNNLVYIDPELIPLGFLRKTLEKIEENIGNDYMLPWNLLEKRKMVEWYKTIPMKTSIINQNIVIEFIVPVIARNKKLLYEVIPTPFPKNESLVYIEPNAPYIITDEKQTEIGYLDQNEIDKCWKVGEREHVCAGDFPVYIKQTKFIYCELAILLHSEDEENNCIIKTIPKKDIFMKIKNSNQYYFVMINPTNATKICDGKSENIHLEDTGLLTINDSCSILNTKFEITSQSINVLNRKNEYVSSSFIPYKSNEKKINKYIMNKKDLGDINKEFETIKNQIKYDEILQEHNKRKNQYMQFLPTHIQNGINLSTTTLVIVIFIILIYYYKKGYIKKDINVITYKQEPKIDKEICNV